MKIIFDSYNKYIYLLYTVYINSNNYAYRKTTKCIGYYYRIYF